MWTSLQHVQPKLSLYNNITITRSYSLECYNSLKQEYKSTEDTKGVIKICKSKDRQQNGKKKRDKRTNNDLRNTTQKTKDRATRTPLKTGLNSGVPEG